MKAKLRGKQLEVFTTPSYLWIILGKLSICLAKYPADWELNYHSVPCCKFSLTVGPLNVDYAAS